MNLSNQASNRVSENQTNKNDAPNTQDEYLTLAVVPDQQYTYDILGTASDWVGTYSVLGNSEQGKRGNKDETRKKYVKFFLITILLLAMLCGFVTFAALFGIEKNIAYERKHLLQRQMIGLKTDLKCLNNTPVDCAGLYDRGVTTSGVYIICPWDKMDAKYRCIQVYCDMVTDGGGWTVIQRRQSGNVSFERDWEEYKMGFGDVSTSYWIGNEILYQLTKEKNRSLYIEIIPLNGTAMFIKYDTFFITEENTGYRLNIVGQATGTLEDKIRNVPPSDVINGAKFSTFDKDNDRSPTNCASEHRGGWWFNYCHDVYLNGLYPPGQWSQPWDPPFPDGTNISSTRMMIRHTNYSKNVLVMKDLDSN